MGRAFDGSSYVQTSLGAIGFAFGPGTVAAVCNIGADDAVDRLIFHGGAASTTPRWAFYRIGATSPDINLYTGAAGVRVTNINASDGWCLVAATKATGTVAPRGHKYVYNSGVWTHADSASTLANSGIPATTNTIGTSPPVPSSSWLGQIEVVGVWNVVLSDAQIQTLALDFTLANWQAASGTSADLKGMWWLNQEVAAGVTDLTGNGANQAAVVGTYPVEGPPISVIRQPVYGGFPPRILA